MCNSLPLYYIKVSYYRFNIRQLFSWVVRNWKDGGYEEKEEDKLTCREELEQFGMVVPWCSQVEVLCGGNGVRVSANEEGIRERDEIVRCLGLVMGDEEKGMQLKKNVEKWKGLAGEAAMEGGSLDINLKVFVDDVAQGCCK
ncbi:hypothetical protein ES288_D02G023700v1 [Gossypium darwinii]|uniref:Uncharacterized protein n=1 Tax=Gossypium darwinii TaxID=34276 RepID=A0A5D2D8S1_GOSDA|nr:hypothetical protein ES288_D02G023700v1 [Gossypium darwinii]